MACYDHTGSRGLPKSNNLNISTIKLAIIEDHLNTMPRKPHNWNTPPHNIYNALSRNHR